jgi:hypothetical protein
VFTYALLGLAAVVVIGLLFWAANRHDRTDETERFQYARELTSRWSAEGGPEAEPAGEKRRGRASRRDSGHSSAA